MPLFIEKLNPPDVKFVLTWNFIQEFIWKIYPENFYCFRRRSPTPLRVSI